MVFKLVLDTHYHLLNYYDLSVSPYSYIHILLMDWLIYSLSGLLVPVWGLSAPAQGEPWPWHSAYGVFPRGWLGLDVLWISSMLLMKDDKRICTLYSKKSESFTMKCMNLRNKLISYIFSKKIAYKIKEYWYLKVYFLDLKLFQFLIDYSNNPC